MQKQSTNLVTVLCAYAGFIALGSYGGLIGVAWPSIRDQFSVGNEAFGALILAHTAGHVAASFANGWMIRRLGIPALLIISPVAMLAGAFMFIVAGQWLLLLFGAFVIGVGAGMIDAGLNTYAAAQFRPRLLNWLHASFALGSTLAATWMGAVVSRELNWRIGVGIMAVLFALMVVIFVLSRNRWTITDEQTDNSGQSTIVHAPPAATLRLLLVWIGIALFTLYTGLEIAVGNWNFTLFTESRNVDIETATLIASLYWGSFTVGRIVLGFIETNLGRLIRIGMIGTLLGVALLLFSGSQVLGVIGILLTGAAQAPIFPALVALTPERVGKEHAANAIGYQIGAAGFGGALVPAFAGVIAAQISLEAIVPLLVVTAAAMLLSNEWLDRAGRNQ